MDGRAVDASGPNAEQIKFWNEVGAPHWIRDEIVMDAMLEPIGRIAMDAASISSGSRVLDVGCGCGSTSIKLARRVGPRGSVVGLDIAAPMVERARERARQAGIENVRFIDGDAQTFAFRAAEFDLVYSRFGVMFFADPVAAFANLASAVRPGGGFSFVCWQSPSLNEWLTVPMAAAAKHLTFTPPADRNAPGPFSLADPDRVRGILSAAGLAGIQVADRKEKMALGGASTTVERAAELMLDVGPIAAALREAGNDQALRRKVAASVRDALAPYQTSSGVQLGCALWLVAPRRQ